MKKLVLLPVMLIALSGCTKTAEVTYTVPAVEGVDEVVEETETFSTLKNGYYSVGQNFESTGNEKEFTTSTSGNYVVGEDIEPGLYDIEAVSGSGTVQEPDTLVVNSMLGVTEDEYYQNYYDNVTLQEGMTIEVSGVSIKFIPQKGSEDVIMPGTYNVVATDGEGTIQETTDLAINEMMGKFEDEYYVTNFDNLTLEQGMVLNTDGVAVDLNPTQKTVVTVEAVDPVAAYDVTERIEVDSDGTETCYINDELVLICQRLQEYDSLIAEIEGN